MFRKLAIVSVTTRCNHACIFCSEGGEHDHQDVPLATVERRLAELQERGYDAVNFMGAETALRKDVPALLALVRAHGLKAALTTNGSRFASAEFAAEIVPALACIEVSVPAGDRQGHERITGRDDFAKVMDGLRNIGRISRSLDEPVAVMINTVVCRENRAAPAAVAELLSGIDLGPLRLLHLIRARAEGRAAGTDLPLNLEQCTASFRAGVKAAKALGVPVMFRGLPTCCLFDEVEHNFGALEALTQPDNTYLNRGPVDDATPIDENAGLDRQGRRFLPACQGCPARWLCPGIFESTPDDPFIAPPDPCPPRSELSERMRRGPLAHFVL